MHFANLAEATKEPEINIQVIEQARHDMSAAYLHGAPGVMASGFIWFTSGRVAWLASPQKAVWTLLIGGMFIHPLSILVNKMLGASATHTPNNPLLGKLALKKSKANAPSAEKSTTGLIIMQP